MAAYLIIIKPERPGKVKVKKLHKWNLSYSQAIELQKVLSGRLKSAPMPKPPKIVAGLDCAFSPDGRKIIAAAVVLKMPDFEVIETRTATQKVNFPYIPGLLSFREAPVCIAVVQRLKSVPDLFIIDGQGIAHPRRLGLAAHLGLFFEKPTIGCAKSRLTGNFEPPPLEKGTFTLLKDKQQVIGAVLRTRTNVKPVFVSVGDRCQLKEAVELTLACTTRYRLPEPTRLAHQFVSKARADY